ncbi:MAG: tetratricopeptide repeat protein [Deltaproteobacteria bacterium]|nr:tetratricopeptide repeat protein [Deltaproteobacteria bacterium]
MDDALLGRFFPPPLRFESEADLTKHKSRLLMEARWLGDAPFAAVLFQQAGALEERLAQLNGGKGASLDSAGPTRSDHLVSAATCYVHSGEFRDAERILSLPAVTVRASAQPFFGRIGRLKKAWAEHRPALLKAFLSHEWSQVVKAISPELFGKVPLKALLWPVFRTAVEEKRGPEALEALRCLILAYPSDIQFHVLYLDAGFGGTGSSEAVSYAKELVAAFPKELAAHAGLVTALVRTASFDEAIPAGERALQLVRTSPREEKEWRSTTVSLVFAATSIALRRAGRPAEARALLAEVVQRLPDDPELRALYALTLFATGDRDSAEAQASIAARQIEQETDETTNRIRSSWPHTIAGRLALHRGAFDVAASFLKRAVMLPGPTRARNYNDLGVAQAGLGDYAAAEASFREAVRIDPSYALPVANLEQLPKRLTLQKDSGELNNEMENDLFRVYREHVVAHEDRRLAA